MNGQVSIGQKQIHVSYMKFDTCNQYNALLCRHLPNRLFLSCSGKPQAVARMRGKLKLLSNDSRWQKIRGAVFMKRKCQNAVVLTLKDPTQMHRKINN
jgi:hypothetical protein